MSDESWPEDWPVEAIGRIESLEDERDALAADCAALGGTCTRLAEEVARLKEQVGQVSLAEYAKGEEVTRLEALLRLTQTERDTLAREYHAAKDEAKALAAHCDHYEGEIERLKAHNSELLDKLGARSEDNRRLREALEGLVSRLHAVHRNSKYRRVWAEAERHLGTYRGPFYDDELNAARAALSGGKA